MVKVMNLKRIGTIISREYFIRVKKKSFIFITLLTPLFFLLIMLVPSLIMLSGGGEDEVRKVVVLDNTTMLSQYFHNEEKIEYQLFDNQTTIDELKEQMDELEAFAIVNIMPIEGSLDVKVESFSKEALSVEIKTKVESIIEDAIEDIKLKSYNIENLDQIIANINTNVSIRTYTIAEDGTEKSESVELYMVLSYLLSFLIYMFVLLFGSMILRSVIEEKSSRVVEVIISSVKSFELMMGKIIGVALVALTQFFIWIAFTLILFFTAQSIIGVNLLSDPSSIEMVSTIGAGVQMEDTLTGDTSSVDKLSSEIQAALNDEDSFVSSIVQQIKDINFVYIILCFIFYFIFGYLLYASLFAAIGSAVDNEADTQQLQIPVTIPLILGLFIMLHTFQYPDSGLSFWASIIPFTSPMVMMARVPFGTVPGWELALSMVLMVITFVGIAYISGKIYKVGILSYGKKASFKDLYKWIKYKN